MKCGSLISILLVVIMITSGPLALPLAQVVNMAGTPSANANPLAQQGSLAVDSGADASPSPTIEPKITVHCSATSGSSPMFVTFTADITPTNATKSIQLYKWDFNGDGLDDYVSLDTAHTTHVYESNSSTKYTATLTVVMTDGSTARGSTTISVEPTDPIQWLEIRDMGPCKFGINSNGSIIIFDQTNWIPLTFAKNANTLISPTLNKANIDESRVTYDTKNTLLEVNIVYGAEGRATFNITEYLPKGSTDTSKLGGITYPQARTSGSLTFSYLDSPPQKPADTGVVDVLYFPQVQTGTGNVWGTGGASYNPWRDQGVTPFGEYFNNLQEYVSTQTGFFTITQTDLSIPGRGLDLVLKRVSAPPSTFEDGQPASAADYSYMDNPWAPMGNGWSLSFPWIDYSQGGVPTYIHLGNGQRYLYNNTPGMEHEYHSGDHFKLYKYVNGTYALYTVDGVEYMFDSAYKPTKIQDPSGNQITFSYASNKLNTITDTIGRTATLSYNADGLVSSISYGGLTVSYTYSNGLTSGKRLETVTDPEGRVTTYRYFNDYLVSEVDYPTGGYSTYTYNAYYSSGYSRYRVTSQTIHDSATNVNTVRTYAYTATYGSVTVIYIKDLVSGVLQTETDIDYSTSGHVIEYKYDPTYSSIYWSNQYTDMNRRRITTYKYLGGGGNPNSTICRYDKWDNLLYYKEYLGQIHYYSYLNNEYGNKFVDSGGSQVNYFSDSFYTSTPNAEIHNLLSGEAEFQDGVGSTIVESYHKYDSSGHNVESKSLLSGSWSITKTDYDVYGNPKKVTDPNNDLTFYVYNATYSGAYLTSIKRTLSGTPSQNLTISYGYNSTTGLLTRMVNEKGNSTSYKYDDVGRTTKVTYPSVDGVAAKRSAIYSDDAVYTSTYSPNTVVSATSTPYVAWTGRFIIRAVGLWWAFYYDGTYIQYKTSVDGSTWTTATTQLTTGIDNWGVFYDGQYFHFALARNNPQYKLLYLRGQPHPDGSITWGSTQTLMTNDGSNYNDCKVTVDSDGYAWVAFQYLNSVEVFKNANRDGTWSTASSQSWSIDPNVEPKIKLVSLTSGKVALVVSEKEYLGSYDLICRVNSGSWGSAETVTTWSGSVQPFDVVASGDDVYVAYQTTSNGVQFKKRDYNSATWGTASNIVSNRPVQLVKTDYNLIYAFYVSGTNINYKSYDGSAWSSEYTLVSGDSPMSVNCISASYQATDKHIGVVYQKNSSGYSVRFVIYSLGETRDPSMTTIDENGNKVVNYYDGLGRLVDAERYVGSVSYSNETYTYNYLGLVSSKMLATGDTYTYDYDCLGTVIKTTNPDGSHSSTTVNYLTGSFDTLDEVGRRKILVYDCMNQLVKVKEYYDSTHYYTTTYTYDLSGNLKKVIDANQHDTNYQYNQLNMMTRATYPDSTYEQIGYDMAGNLRWTFKRDGSNVTQSYDSLNRLKQVSFPDGTSSTFGYDKAGERISSSYNGTSVNQSYDARGRMVSESDTVSGSIYYINYGFDLAGNVASMRYPDGSVVDMRYDSLNRITDLGSYGRFSYDKDGRITKITYANGVSQSYTYDTSGRPIDITLDAGWLADPLSGWGNRVKVTIDESKVDADLSDFPVLIHLSAASGINSYDATPIFTEVGSSSLKIAFTRGDGVTQLYAEVESWDSNAKQAYVWVRVPRVSGSADTNLYLYYEGAHADNVDYVGPTGSAPAEKVWDAGFETVQHLTGADYQHLNDSTSYGNDPSNTPYGTPDYNQAARISSGVKFTRSSDEALSIPDATRLDGWTGEATIEVFYKPTTLPSTSGDQHNILSKWYSNTNERSWFVDLKKDTSLSVQIGMSNNGVGYVTHQEVTTLSTGRWTQFVWKFEPGATAVLYINGTLQTGVTMTDVSHGSQTVSNIFDCGRPLLIGKGEYATTRGADGVVDEVRVSSVGRSDAWVSADYYSQVDKLVSYSAESLTRWDNRWRITVDESKIDSDLTSYPVLIHIGASSGTMATDTRKVFDEVGASYLKIAFTLGDGCTQLLAEVDSWDSTTKEGYVWVRVPILSSSANTTLYMYYDKDQADNTAFIGATGSSVGEKVWDSGFQMVQHMTGANAAALDDSSSHSNDVSSATGTPDYNQAAVDGKGVNFDHSASPEESLSVPDANGLDGWTGQATIEFVYKPTSLPSAQDERYQILNKYTSTNGQRSWYVDIHKWNDYLETRLFMSDDGTAYVYDGKTFAFQSGVSYHMVWVFVPGGTAKLYINGVPQSGVWRNIGTNDVDTVSSICNSAQPLVIGRAPYSSPRVVDGVVDEVLISNVGRSDAWLKADYYSMTDGLVSFSEAPLMKLSYTYDDSGSVTGIGGSVSESYGYDQLDRLTSSAGLWGSVSYTYDPVGNMLSKGATSYTYNNVNELVTAGSDKSYYTLDGGLRGRGATGSVWNYTYDVLDQLKTVKNNGALKGSYVYDADGRRVRAWDPSSGWTASTYSGLNIVSEVPATGLSHATDRFYVGGLQVAEVQDGMVSFLHQDALGSTRAKTDAGGNLVYLSGYQPFGPSQGEVSSEKFKYTGKPTDSSTGLYYYGARYYDPTTGRFITVDTTLGSLNNPQSLNRYEYCLNNPLKYTDPDGHFVFLAVLGAMAVQGLVCCSISTVVYAATNWNNRNDPSFKTGLAQAMVTGFISGAITGGIGSIVTQSIAEVVATSTPEIIQSVQLAGKTLNTMGKVYASSISMASGLAMHSSMERLSNSEVKNTMISASISTSISTISPLYPAGNQLLDFITSTINTKIVTSAIMSLYTQRQNEIATNQYYQEYDQIERMRTEGS